MHVLVVASKVCTLGARRIYVSLLSVWGDQGLLSHGLLWWKKGSNFKGSSSLYTSTRLMHAACISESRSAMRPPQSSTDPSIKWQMTQTRAVVVVAGRQAAARPRSRTSS